MGNGASIRNLDESGVGSYDGTDEGGERKPVKGILNRTSEEAYYGAEGGYYGAGEGEDGWAEVEYGDESWYNWEAAPADSSDETVRFTL